MSALLEVDNLSKQFVTRSGLFKRTVKEAVKPVSFSLEPGQTIGFIGQNGSGKSTLARMLAGVVEPSSGEIRVNGERLEHKDYSTRCKLIRMIFQDPNTSLNPRIQIGRILEGPLKRNTNMPPDARMKRVKAKPYFELVCCRNMRTSTLKCSQQVRNNACALLVH